MTSKASHPLLAAFAIVVFAYLLLKVILSQLAAMKESSYQAGFDSATAIHAKAMSAALLAQQQQLQADFSRQLKLANAANAAIRAEKHALAERARALEEEIDYVTTYYLAGSTAELEPLPACIFTTGFVGVYNSAIGAKPDITATLPSVSTAERVDAAARPASAINPKTDILQPSGVGQADILQHLTGYGARCLAIEAQLNGLIDYLEQEQRRTMDGT